jgi:hypothetical protein
MGERREAMVKTACIQMEPVVGEKNGPASYDREEIIYAEANLANARRKRNWNEYNQVLRDRRGDVYAEMLGAEIWPGWY